MSDELDRQTEDAIRNLEREYQQAMLDADVAWFERNWAPDLLYVHTSGRTDERDTFVGLIRTGEHKHVKRDSGDIRIRRYGDAVVVTGRQYSEIVANGAPAKAYDTRFTRVYSKIGGRWLCVSSQSGQNTPR